MSQYSSVHRTNGITILAGEKINLLLIIENPSIISYKIRVGDKLDIDLSALVIHNTNNKCIESVPSHRCQEESALFEINSNSKCVFTLSNEFSWLTPKTVAYEITISPKNISQEKERISEILTEETEKTLEKREISLKEKLLELEKIAEELRNKLSKEIENEKELQEKKLDCLAQQTGLEEKLETLERENLKKKIDVKAISEEIEEMSLSLENILQKESSNNNHNNSQRRGSSGSLFDDDEFSIDFSVNLSFHPDREDNYDDNNDNNNNNNNNNNELLNGDKKKKKNRRVKFRKQDEIVSFYSDLIASQWRMARKRTKQKENRSLFRALIDRNLPPTLELCVHSPNSTIITNGIAAIPKTTKQK